VVAARSEPRLGLAVLVEQARQHGVGGAQMMQRGAYG
jgi:hypothetical protein